MQPPFYWNIIFQADFISELLYAKTNLRHTVRWSDLY